MAYTMLCTFNGTIGHNYLQEKYFVNESIYLVIGDMISFGRRVVIYLSWNNGENNEKTLEDNHYIADSRIIW